MNSQHERPIYFVPSLHGPEEMAKLREMKTRYAMGTEGIPYATQHPSEQNRQLIPEFTPHPEVLSLWNKLHDRFLEDARFNKVSPIPNNHSFMWTYGESEYAFTRIVSEESTSFFFLRSSTRKMLGHRTEPTPITAFSVDSNGMFKSYVFIPDTSGPNLIIKPEVAAEHTIKQPRFDDKAEAHLKKAHEAVTTFFTTSAHTSR